MDKFTKSLELYFYINFFQLTLILLRLYLKPTESYYFCLFSSCLVKIRPNCWKLLLLRFSNKQVYWKNQKSIRVFVLLIILFNFKLLLVRNNLWNILSTVTSLHYKCTERWLKYIFEFLPRATDSSSTCVNSAKLSKPNQLYRLFIAKWTFSKIAVT